MTKLHLFRCMAFSIMFALHLHVRAQNSTPPTTQRVSCFAFEFPAERKEIYLMTGTNEFQKVSLSRANATPYLEVSNTDGYIHIFDKPVVDEEGNTTALKLGKIKSPLKWKEVMAILVDKQRGGKEEFFGLAFSTAEEDLPPGGMKFANFSPYPVRGVVGHSVLKVRPGEIRTVSFSDPEGSMIDVIFQYQIEEKWRRMMATRWSVSDRERTLIFAFRNPLTGNMVSKSIPLRDS